MDARADSPPPLGYMIIPPRWWVNLGFGILLVGWGNPQPTRLLRLKP